MIESNLRRTCALLLVIALLGAGCAGSGDADGSGASADATSAATLEAKTTEAVDDEEAVGDEENAGEAAAAPDVRVVETMFGSFEIPADPQRIVVLDPVIALPTALDLGAPVIATQASVQGRPATTLVTEEEWAGLDILGLTGEANLEAIAAADPDLILSSPSTEQEFSLHAQIAPSVPLVLTNVWQDDSRLAAASLGREEEMEVLLDAYTDRADAVAARLDDELGDPAVAVVRIRPDSIRVHTSVHFAGNILDDVGLRMPEEWVRTPLEDPVANLQQRLVRISPEQLGMLDTADHLIVLAQGTPSQSEDDVAAAFEEVTGGDLWQTLPAVQAGNVHLVEGYWLAGSLRAATLAVDDVERLLLS
ncbi:MAG: ABC transporter substrate-binding protein [Actinomycetota bacterium]